MQKANQPMRARSYERNSGQSRGEPLSNNFYNNGGNEFNFTNSYNDAPMPHPRPQPPSMMQDMASDNDPVFSRRDLSSPRNIASSSAVGPLGNPSANGQQRQNSRGSNPPAGGRRSAAQSAGRKPLHGRGQDATTMPEPIPLPGSSQAAAAKESQIDQELKTLRFELQQQSEVIVLKTETVRNLQEQLDQQKRRLTTDAQKVQTELQRENEALKKELQLCKADEVKKEAGLTELKRQCEELTKSRNIEMSLLINKPMTTAPAVKQSSEESAAKPKGKTKAQKNLQFAKDLNAEMELMFADDDFKIKPNKKQKKRESKQKQAQANANSTQPCDQSVVTRGAKGPILAHDLLLQNQIQAAILAETLIDEIKSMENAQTTEVADLKNSCTSLEVHSKTLLEEKMYLSQRVTELSRTNDDLKRKFSALLDQFQEYVTLQETKQADDEQKAKAQQEQLLQNMQDNIKELEQVTESLQNELQNKEEVFEVLKRENRELQAKLAQKVQEENISSQQAMRRLEDELGFLKRHHDLEINMLKEQYERSLETAKLIAQETAKMKELPQSNLQNELRDSVSMAGRSESVRLSDNQPYMPQQNNFMNQQNEQYQRQTSPMSNDVQDAQGTNGRAKEMLHTTQQTFDKLKKDLTEKELLIEEKNREILRLRVANEEAVRFAPGPSKRDQVHHDPQLALQNNEQRGQIVADLSYSIDSLRSELMRVKQTLFAQIGKHINFDAPTNLQANVRSIAREEDLHSEVIIQLSEIRALVSLTQEINMLASSSITHTARQQSTSKAAERGSSQSPDTVNKTGGTARASPLQGGKTSLESNYQIKRSADQMLRQNHTSGLHDLVLEQITRSETLMNDNALMQRQLYKYETTLAELDVILRSDKRDKSIFELKKLVESQLKQILVLQKELEQARQGQMMPLNNPNSASQSMLNQSMQQPSFMPANNASQPDLNSQKEVESLKYQIQEQQVANQELISERRNLMELAESYENQAKDNHRNMEKALNRVGLIEKELEDKNAQFEDIRERITKVAELFERKEIKQKYSFEVLCDFIHDKAKRLFAKYEAASKERRVMQEEKNFYFQRKLDQLEQENFAMKETNRAAERIIHELIPNLAQLLDRPLIQSNELSEYYYARTVLEQIEIEYRNIKKAHMIMQERNNELQLQINALKSSNDVSRTNSRMQGQSTIENCAPNQQQHSFGNIITTGFMKPAGSHDATSPNNVPSSTQYRDNQLGNRSAFDQKISEARAQEQQEIQTSLQNERNQVISGHGMVVGIGGQGSTTANRQPHSPLQMNYTPTGESAQRHMHHLRNKSIERDDKDSPHKAPWARDSSHGPPERDTAGKSPLGGQGSGTGYQGMMGTHLTTNENNK